MLVTRFASATRACLRVNIIKSYALDLISKYQSKYVAGAMKVGLIEFGNGIIIAMV